ncbi:hypothetical protein [Gordonia insulae]|uniref:Uncharacterized protein n=1 Tax=Gordonia insulae TaxID=2420509 RepID=A0A3G8JRK4_9ACTN|nr:hypothetical protein [Gordonia insulae]AZG47159.1 hypothetical protein D7316_03767 [Gordonia insulae]
MKSRSALAALVSGIAMTAAIASTGAAGAAVLPPGPQLDGAAYGIVRGCSYTISALADGAEPVYFQAAKPGEPAVFIGYAQVINGRATAANRFQPPVAGDWTLFASQGEQYPPLTTKVTVVEGLNFGSMCVGF